MAYIARTPAYGAFEKQTLTADSSTTTFALNFTVGSSSSVLVSVAGVIQEPEVGYSLSGGGVNIVFSTAPTSGDSVFVVFLGLARDVDNIANTGTITNKTELAETAADDDLLLIYDTSVGQLKKVQKQYVGVNINTTTALAEEPASGDKLLVYDADAGTNKAVEYQYINPTLTYTNGTFTGDGSTTTITIDSGHTVNTVLVSVNGFTFIPTTDYTISGTTLTFSTAPASGAEISVRYLALSGSATYTNDTATGDGSTVAFTIDSGRTVEDVITTVNGVILAPATDYTISGTTLTFTEAPAASAEISFRYLRTS